MIVMKLTPRRVEQLRQVTHIALGLFVLAIIMFIPFYVIVLTLMTLTVLILSILAKKNVYLPFTRNLFKLFQREDERKGIQAKGLLFFSLGSLITTILFTKQIALASIAILTLCDSLPRLILHHGKIKHPLNNKRFIEEMIIGIIVGTIGGWLFVPFLFAVIAASIAAIVEILDIIIKGHRLDDNLYIPVVAGTVIFLLTLVL